jgi:GTP-binding protein HflX
MTQQSQSKLKTAVLFSVQRPGVSDEENESSLVELGRLVTTLGLQVVGSLSQKRKAPAVSSIVGAGKLAELAAYTGGSGIIEGFSKKTGHQPEDDVEDEEEDTEAEDSESDKPHADVAVYDGEITPNQLQNLEKALGVEVLDRTGVILEIFSKHAGSREARLQVEIAKLQYMAPRLRASSTGGDRSGGGIGAKGAGETAHELDRRRIRDRIAELRGELNSIHNEQGQRRLKRREAPCAALVGYTNAGKSSLMRALTGSEVLVADKLFATLDTRVRPLHPRSFPDVLISDTVGFIKKLPHDLVASFRSTLDEALNASLLLFTVDASDPAFRSQLEVTQKVLGEIGAQDIPSKFVLNKVDRMSADEVEELRKEFPDALFISTRSQDDINYVRSEILKFFEQGMAEEDIMVPYTKGELLGEIRLVAKVISERYEENGTYLKIKAELSTLEHLKRKSLS